MKIMCRWCQNSKHCHTVHQKITSYDSEFGTDKVTTLHVKIHKHHKGNILCQGSNKIIKICLEDEMLMKGFKS